MMRRSFQVTSMSCDVHHQMHPSFEVVGFEHRRFFFLLPPVTLWIQDTSGLLDTIGHRSLAFTSWLFFSIPKYFKSPSASPPKNVQPTFELLTPLSNNQHVPQKICIKNPAKSANLHRLRHGFGHSHDGSLCPRICRIKGAILRPSRPEGDLAGVLLVGFFVWENKTPTLKCFNHGKSGKKPGFCF